MLVVDDNRQMRVLTRALLRAAGFIASLKPPARFEAVRADEPLSGRSDFGRLEDEAGGWAGVHQNGALRQTAQTAYVPILMMTAHTEMSRWPRRAMRASTASCASRSARAFCLSA